MVGDPVYGGTKRAIPSEIGKTAQRELAPLLENLRGQALHAYSLSFEHPVTGEHLSFEAPLPGDFESLLSWLRGRRAG